MIRLCLRHSCCCGFMYVCVSLFTLSKETKKKREHHILRSILGNAGKKNNRKNFSHEFHRPQIPICVSVIFFPVFCHVNYFCANQKNHGRTFNMNVEIVWPIWTIVYEWIHNSMKSFSAMDFQERTKRLAFLHYSKKKKRKKNCHEKKKKERKK